MLRSINKHYEEKLGASDGEIGHVKDFYFDDQNWAVRYLVADTGSWMPGRLVLISPHALGAFYQGGRVLLVNLTRQQVENSPLIESHKPVSRQYEEAYHRFYGWPFYWQGGQLWGVSAFPVILPPPSRLSGEQVTAKGGNQETGDPHLRSTKAMIGYQAKKWIDSFAAALGGLDTLVFAGGIGENAPPVRERICEGLDYLGIKLDKARNKKNAAMIFTNAGRVKVRVIHTNEELMIARSVLRSCPAITAGKRKLN